MKKNMGNTDRLIRLMLGVVFGILYFNNKFSKVRFGNLIYWDLFGIYYLYFGI